MGQSQSHRTPQRSYMLSMEIFWMPRGGLFLFFLLLGTVSGMDHSSPSMPDSQLSTLGSQLMQLQEQVEALQQEKLEDKEQIVQLMNITEELENRVSLLESKCASDEVETDISGSIMAIGGWNNGRRDYETRLRSAEVLNTSCDFPLPEGRYSHISVTTADGKTLVCGGQTTSGYTASCLQFNFQSKTWEHHSNMKSKNRAFASAIAVQSGVYIFGGYDEAWNTSEFLATGSFEWTHGPQVDKGVRFSCAAKLSDTEFVIVLGGSEALVYDTITQRWTNWPRMTRGVFGHSCIRLGDTVLMAGGSRTVLFDTKTGSAREVASLKYPRAHASMVVYNGRALILGGNDGKIWRNDGEMWNMDTETWEEADIHLNIGREYFSLVTMAEEIDCN